MSFEINKFICAVLTGILLFLLSSFIAELLYHPEVKGLYPCAEGAGYAGGIVSAAIDGIKVMDATLLNHKNL